jgi:hypothetical protein
MRLSGKVILAVIIMTLSACGNAGSEAKKQADLIKQATHDNMPGTIETSQDGYYLKAKIDGKVWAATHMMPDESTNSAYFRVYGEKNGESISFSLSAGNLQSGVKKQFDESNAADLMMNEESGGIYGGRKGEIQIIKSDGQWIEGIFHFSANSSLSKSTHEITEGFFRVPFPSKNSSARQ